MREIITYRLSATGVWGYEFYHPDRTLIGSVSSVLAPSAAVRIEGGPIRWYSRFDIDTRIVPGIGRKIKDNRTGDEVYRIIREQKKTAILVTHDISEAVSMADRVLVFSKRPSHVKTVIETGFSAALSPLERRHVPEFLPLYDRVWKEIDR